MDSDLCARLMLGPITPARIECSQKTHKEGSAPVLVRLSNNMVLDVNKNKMISTLVGQLVEASGELKVKDAEVKLKGVGPIQASSIPAEIPHGNCLMCELTGLPMRHSYTRKSDMSSP